jgi:hypothetical protein
MDSPGQADYTHHVRGGWHLLQPRSCSLGLATCSMRPSTLAAGLYTRAFVTLQPKLAAFWPLLYCWGFCCIDWHACICSQQLPAIHGSCWHHWLCTLSVALH